MLDEHGKKSARRGKEARTKLVAEVSPDTFRLATARAEALAVKLADADRPMTALENAVKPAAA